MSGPEITPTVETGPFPTGGRIVHNGVDQGWSIENDGTVVTLTREREREGSPDGLGASYRLDGALKRYPAMGRIIGLGQTNETLRRTIGRVPTIAGINAFTREMFGGLPVANIKYVQTGHPDETPIDDFMAGLGENELRTSLGYSIYLHDLLVHMMGVGSTHRRSFEVFQALWNRRQEVTEGHGENVAHAYVCALGDGFDLSTGLVIDPFVMESKPPRQAERYFLLTATLGAVSMRCPGGVLARVKNVVAGFAMGTITTTPDTIGINRFVVPWEEQNLPAHYAQVQARLAATSPQTS